jgi:hypothetical protein
MSTLGLWLPESLHEMARDLAARENILINQLIALALAEKISARATERYFDERAKRGSRAKFENAMAKVARDEPVEHDPLPGRGKRR